MASHHVLIGAKQCLDIVDGLDLDYGISAAVERSDDGTAIVRIVGGDSKNVKTALAEVLMEIGGSFVEKEAGDEM